MTPTPNPQESNFYEIENIFDFPQLLSAIESQRREKISAITRKYFRGVLLEGSTEKVAKKCGVSKETVRVNLSTEIVPYLKPILELPTESRIIWRDIPEKLKEKGFAKPQKNISKQPIKSRNKISFDDSLYIDRPPIESLCYGEILKEGALIRIKALPKMGKTSLLNKILCYATSQGYQIVRFSLLKLNESTLKNQSKFLHSFCSNVSISLNLANKTDNYWHESYGSNDKCTSYFEEYLLPQIDVPIVIGIENLERVFPYQEVATDFCSLLRFWYEEGKIMDTWQKVRLVVIHSTEAYIPIDINKSPFNIGLPIELSEFTEEQVCELASANQLDISNIEIKKLMSMVGGHPHLLQTTFNNLKRYSDNRLDEILATATTETGIYKSHLRELWSSLLENPNLIEAMKMVTDSIEPINLTEDEAFKLENLGLVHRESNNNVVARCNLYRLYFREHLEPILRERSLHKEHKIKSPQRQDWGNAPDVSLFYDRTQDLTTLEKWIVEDRCRLIALRGPNGIGKTTLSVKLAQNLQDNFEYVIWRSLGDTPPVEKIVADLLAFFGEDGEPVLPDTLAERMTLLLEYLRSHRCLIVLDEVEAILEAGQLSGKYQEKYRDYGRLFQHIAKSNHLSCLLLTTAEELIQISLLANDNSPVRYYQVQGLEKAAAKALLKNIGLIEETELNSLINRYESNPLYLKIVGAMIRDFFAGKASEYLKKETIYLGEIKEILDPIFERMTSLEIKVICQIANYNTPLDLDELQQRIKASISTSKFLEALNSLKSRCLLEKSSAGNEQGLFTISKVVRKYIYNRFNSNSF